MDTLTISEWDETHPRWNQFLRLVDSLEQSDWLEFKAPWHKSAHYLVAATETEIEGFLYFVTQDIGEEDDHQAISFNGKILVEAKVIAFGVAPAYRRQGLGRKLQLAAIELATRLDCYQLRSHSSGTNLENHRLKLDLGFSVQPVIRDGDDAGVYFFNEAAKQIAKFSLEKYRKSLWVQD